MIHPKLCFNFPQLSSVLTSVAPVSVWSPTLALLFSSLVLHQGAAQRAAIASMEMCLMGTSVYSTVSVDVFIMEDISR